MHQVAAFLTVIHRTLAAGQYGGLIPVKTGVGQFNENRRLEKLGPRKKRYINVRSNPPWEMVERAQR
jgi:hypothetical protein